MNYIIITLLGLTTIIFSYFWLKIARKNKKLSKNEELLISKFCELNKTNKTLQNTIVRMGNTIESYKAKYDSCQELIQNFEDRYDGAVMVADEYLEKIKLLKEENEELKIQLKTTREDFKFSQMLLSGDVDNWNWNEISYKFYNFVAYFV